MLLPPTMPTLWSSAKTETRPDNVFGTADLKEQLVLCRAVPSHRPINSDHYPIETELDISVARSAPVSKYNYSRADWATVREVLEQNLATLDPPSEAESPQDVLNKYTELHDAIVGAVEAGVPKMVITPFTRRWYTPELKALRANARKANRIAQRHKGDSDHYSHEEYRHLRQAY
ncbi:hypothetical protein BC629DRAFT_1259681, partial [Irpex lacteus]